MEWVNLDDELEYIDIEIDGQAFRMDKGDAWTVLCVAQPVFDRMNDPVPNQQNG